MVRLKTCPFCGSPARLQEPHINFPCEIYWHGVCTECYTIGPAGYSKEDAAKAWNRRADDGTA